MTPKAARTYLEECATACPECGELGGLIRRLFWATTPPLGDERPVVRVPCSCAMCGARWAEVYRLEAVDADPIQTG